MADLRKRFLEDYAGGFLNVARQEISSAGEVLVQDGFTSQGTLFVEDGAGVKSGLKLGVSLAEAIDPTTPQGIVNVRYADRTFAKIRDLKIFSTAIASAQAALSEATSVSITNLESSLQILEDSITANNQNVDNTVSSLSNTASLAISGVNELSDTVSTLSTNVQNLTNRVSTLEGGGTDAPSIPNLGAGLTSRTTVSGTTSSIADGVAENLDITAFRGYNLFKIDTSHAAWVTVYCSNDSRTNDASRPETTDPLPGSGVIAEVITTGEETILISPGVVGFNDDSPVAPSIPIKVVNKSGSSAAITVTLTVLQTEA
jgi:hypothetical protein